MPTITGKPGTELRVAITIAGTSATAERCRSEQGSNNRNASNSREVTHRRD
jgi:hypothetical protein